MERDTMCEGHRHFCSNCGSGVDGKNSEFFDFTIDLKKGRPTHKRTVICGRCQKSPKVKEMLKMAKEIKKLKPKKSPKKVEKIIPGALQCEHCLKLITYNTPHVALSSFWDVKHKRFKYGNAVLCKQCYDSDPKTKAMWQYLASIGKNPTFTPVVQCAMFDNCPTAEKPKEEDNDFRQCTGIAVIDTVEGFKMVCNFAHPGFKVVPDGDVHIFSGTAIMGRHVDPLAGTHDALTPVLTTSTAAQLAQEELQKKMLEDAEKAFIEMKAGVEEIQDPGMKKFVKGMTAFMDLYMDDIKALQAIGI